MLTLWLDSFSSISPIVVTHEIKHWALKLKGLRTVACEPKPHGNIEILLNSFVHHPSIYVPQRSLGYEPQPEIDSRALNDITVFSEKKETRDTQSWIPNALLFTDDLTNYSDTYQRWLKVAVKSMVDTASKDVQYD